MAELNERKDGISPELDALSSELLGEAFDVLADGRSLNVVLVVEDQAGHIASYEFSDDGPEELLQGAHKCVQSLVKHKGDKDEGLQDPVRYALVYEGAIALTNNDGYKDAVLLEFGEKGYKSFSAYSFVAGKGKGEEFTWSEPAPAGEIEPLL